MWVDVMDDARFLLDTAFFHGRLWPQSKPALGFSVSPHSHREYTALSLAFCCGSGWPMRMLSQERDQRPRACSLRSRPKEAQWLTIKIVPDATGALCEVPIERFQI